MTLEDKAWLDSFYAQVAYEHFKSTADSGTFYSVADPSVKEEDSVLISLSAASGEQKTAKLDDALRSELIGDVDADLGLDILAAIEQECGLAEPAAAQLQLETDDVGCSVAGGQPVDPPPADRSCSAIVQKFFRVVAKAPGKLKRPRTDVDVQVPLHYTAVVHHEVLRFDRKAREVSVQLQATSGRLGSAETSMLLSSDGGSHTLIRWSRSGRLVYMSGPAGKDEVAEDPACSAALEACVSACAWHGERSLELDTSVPEHAQLDKALQALSEKGIATCTGCESSTGRRSYQITEAGASSMHCGMVLHKPVKATAPRRGIPVSEMTHWELIKLLEAEGWRARVTAAATAKGIEPFKVHKAAPKIFWFRRNSKIPNKPYLITLASASRFRGQGVQEVPHLKAASYYAELLRSLGLSRGQRRGRSGKATAMKLEDDDGTVVLPTLASSTQGSHRGGGASGARDGIREPASKASDANAECARRCRGRNVQERSYAFGPHTMVFKPPNSWQATCCRRVSHAKPDRPGTLCTKTMNYKGVDDGADDHLVQRLLRMWLNMCMEHPTRSGHMGVCRSELLDMVPATDFELMDACLDATYKSDPELQQPPVIGDVGELRKSRKRGRRGAGGGGRAAAGVQAKPAKHKLRPSTQAKAKAETAETASKGASASASSSSSSSASSSSSRSSSSSSCNSSSGNGSPSD